MKFNDGFWLLKHGVKPFYGLQVVQHSIENDDAYVLQVATRPIRHRGDTLGGPLLTVKVHAPTEGVIGVKLTHFTPGEPSVKIPLFPDVPPSPKTSLSKTDDHLTLTSGSVSVDITSKPYTLTFKSDKKTLTVAGEKHQAIIDVPYKWTLNSARNTSCMTTDVSSNPSPETPPSTVRYINSELTIAPGELFYGFGEQFGAFVKNGQAISIWNQDGGTSSEQAYKCIPFYLSNKGYGIFINHPGEVEVEVGSEKVSRVGVSVADESLEWFIIHGDTPLQILERYTQMTGRPALPPTWTFGLWLSTSFLTDYDSKTVSGFLQGMKDRKCHISVFHFDCFWMKQYEWCSFTFDPDNFPDPKHYLSELKQKYGVKVCVWINPYISQLSPIFAEAARNGYLIKRKNGSPWQWDLWQPGMGIVDITNQKAKAWYTAKLEALIDLGVDCFKTDFGERIPHTDIMYADGSDPMLMHNMYSVLYNELVFRLLEKRFGKNEAVLFARSSGAGGQRFPVHWGGDCESTFEAMAEAMRGCLSLTLSGFAYASHDIGGFEGHPPPEIYLRWIAFGLFSSHSRLHGSSSYRVPWNYGEEASKTLAKYVDTKHRLMPYLYNAAVEGHIRGYPMQRAMILEFIDDRTTHYLDRQFMLGRSLLVAPVFVSEREESEYYLPAGVWTSFFDPKRKVKGPVWVKEVVALDEIPVWVRENTLLLLGPSGMENAKYALNKGLELQLYEMQDGSKLTAEIRSGEGTELTGSVSAERLGEEIRVEIEGNVGVMSIAVFIDGVSITSADVGRVEDKRVYLSDRSTSQVKIKVNNNNK